MVDFLRWSSLPPVHFTPAQERLIRKLQMANTSQHVTGYEDATLLDIEKWLNGLLEATYVVDMSERGADLSKGSSWGDLTAWRIVRIVHYQIVPGTRPGRYSCVALVERERVQSMDLADAGEPGDEEDESSEG